MKKITFKSKKAKIIVVSIVCLTIGSTVAITTISLSSDTKEIKAAQSNNKIEKLTVKQAIEGSQDSDLMLSGKVVANNTNKIKINPDKGIVKEIFVKEGDTVEKGQALFRYESEQQLKTKEAEFEVNGKNGTLEIARSNAAIKWDIYNKKLAKLNTAKSKYAKEELEELKTEISTLDSEVPQAYSDALAADNEVKAAQNELEKAELSKNVAQELLEKDTVFADNAGTVKTLNADLVNQSKEKQNEENFMEIIDSSQLFVSGEVNEFDREKVSINQQVLVIDRKDSKNTWTGKVSQVSNLDVEKSSEKKEEAEENASKYPYKVLIDEKEEKPLIGSNVYVKLLPKEFEAGKIVLNSKYIVEKSGKYYVWKVDDKEKVTLAEVKATSLGNDLLEINEGLAQEDTIALPLEGMKNGMAVNQSVEA